MANSDDREPTRLAGTSKHVIDVGLLDEATKRRVMECIKQKGKISVEVFNVGPSGRPDIGAGFLKVID